MVDYGLSNEENGVWRRAGSMKSVSNGLRNQKTITPEKMLSKLEINLCTFSVMKAQYHGRKK